MSKNINLNIHVPLTCYRSSEDYLKDIQLEDAEEHKESKDQVIFFVVQFITFI